MNPEDYVFNFDEMDRIPYMAPGLVTKEKAQRGKTPTDVWWHTIVPTHGREKTGYPTQKPLGILSRVIKIHSRPGDVALDFFGGSGTTGEAAACHGRGFVLVDNSADAVAIAAARLERFQPECVGFSPPAAPIFDWHPSHRAGRRRRALRSSSPRPPTVRMTSSTRRTR